MINFTSSVWYERKSTFDFFQNKPYFVAIFENICNNQQLRSYAIRSLDPFLYAIVPNFRPELKNVWDIIKENGGFFGITYRIAAIESTHFNIHFAFGFYKWRQTVLLSKKAMKRQKNIYYYQVQDHERQNGCAGHTSSVCTVQYKS